jgi:hypothetical protein
LTGDRSRSGERQGQGDEEVAGLTGLDPPEREVVRGVRRREGGVGDLDDTRAPVARRRTVGKRGQQPRLVA